MDCSFCNIITQHTERLIRETKNTFVILSNPRLMSGHILVIPKRHVEKLSELSKEERDELFDEAIQLQDKILESVAPGCDISEHFRPFIPNDRLKVGHLHIHLRPRFLNDELYQKVQVYEKEIFQEVGEGEFEKYRALFTR